MLIEIFVSCVLRMTSLCFILFPLRTPSSQVVRPQEADEGAKVQSVVTVVGLSVVTAVVEIVIGIGMIVVTEGMVDATLTNATGAKYRLVSRAN